MAPLCYPVAASASTIPDESMRRGWVDQPNQRGTMDIIVSCVATLFICLWTMLHLNLPAPDDSDWTKLWRKLRWLLLGILAPELPMLFAFAQWASAKRSVKSMRNFGHTNWTLAHAFYADAGGFTLHPPDTKPFPTTAKQLQYLVEESYMELPAITSREIWDKSKADKLAKTIACLQAAWLVSNLCARAAQGLAVTPLELQTLALVFCSLATLCFWLSKPLNVESPTPLHLDTPISTILLRAGDAAKKPFRDTPLDFIEPQIYQSSVWSDGMLRWMQRRHLTTRPLQRRYHPPLTSRALTTDATRMPLQHQARMRVVHLRLVVNRP